MNKTLRTPDYLGHILTAMDRITRYTQDLNLPTFLESELIQDAVIRNIEVVGEAANNIQRVAPDFAADHCDVPWMVMYTMRNRVSHGYEKVDLEIVWNTIKSDFPPFARKNRNNCRQGLGVISSLRFGFFLLLRRGEELVSPASLCLFLLLLPEG